jgi:hypothetical protein
MADMMLPKTLIASLPDSDVAQLVCVVASADGSAPGRLSSVTSLPCPGKGSARAAAAAVRISIAKKGAAAFPERSSWFFGSPHAIRVSPENCLRFSLRRGAAAMVRHWRRISQIVVQTRPCALRFIVGISKTVARTHIDFT